jgi:hypothetical protein
MCFKIKFFFAQKGVDVLHILSCFILHRRSVQKLGRSFFFTCSHVHTLILFWYIYDADLVFRPPQGYLRRLSNSAIFSLQQQFFATTIACNFNTHRDVLVFFIWSLPKFAAYHWLNWSTLPLFLFAYIVNFYKKTSL